jgi:hypothetical protein
MSKILTDAAKTWPESTLALPAPSIRGGVCVGVAVFGVCCAFTSKIKLQLAIGLLKTVLLGVPFASLGLTAGSGDECNEHRARKLLLFVASDLRRIQ